jgi:2-methylisocitrate lyase-like PEP mutase family enzyme
MGVAVVSPGRELRAVIASGESLLMPGCTDPLSGRIFERMGFKALSVGGWMTGASSVVPEPLLTMTEQAVVAGRVAAAVGIPVRVAVMDPGWAKQVREEIEEAQGLPAFWEIERQTVESGAADYTGRTIAGYEGQDTHAARATP